MKIPYGIFISFVLLIPSLSKAQLKRDSSEIVQNAIFNIQFHYTYSFPGGDLANTFGQIHDIGFGGLYKSKTNWLMGLDASYQFSNDVLIYPITNLTNSSGNITNNQGNPSLILLGERGFSAFAKGGKVFPVSFINRNSGIMIMAGIGFYSHMISFTTPADIVPALTDAMKKGYDQLTMGIAFTQFVGYHYQATNRFINFYIGLDVMEAFTHNVRGYDYGQMAVDNSLKHDILFGPRIGWMIPIYLKSKQSDEFYYR